MCSSETSPEWGKERWIRLLYPMGSGYDCNSFIEHGVIMEPSKKPLNVLIKQLHGNLEVVLKNGYEYKGKMIKVDGHMNIMLEGATECKDDQLFANYGNVLLRGNNVLYIVIDSTMH